MRLAVLEHGREWEPVADLGGDGAVFQERRYVGVIRNDTVFDASGRAVFRCNGRTLVDAASGQPMGYFDARDDLVDGRTGRRVATIVNGSQPVLFEGEGGRPLPAQLQGMPPWAKRTGEVLTLFALANGMGRGF